MKKWIVWTLLPVMLLSLLSGCGIGMIPWVTEDSTQQTTDAGTAETTPETTDFDATETTAGQEMLLGDQDSYWVAYEYYDEQYLENRPLETQEWLMDLMIRADGTARFRNIYQQLYMPDEDGLQLTWQRAETGTLQFYSQAYEYPLLEGTWEDGKLSVQYLDMLMTMKEAPMPQGAGELYSPAELAGTWVGVSAEIEGDEWEVLSTQLASIVFRQNITEDTVALLADRECYSNYGDLLEEEHDLELEILDEPLFEGCGNEVWSVRVGPASPVDENGLPVNTEIYVTLLSRDEMLVQNYFTIDGSPGVSQMTYRRIPPFLSWWEVTAGELENTSWRCESYIDNNGDPCEVPEQFRDLELLLGENGVYYADGQRGLWNMYAGGALTLLKNEGTEIWFGGAVGVHCYAETVYEMYLYYEGGLLKFTIDSYG